MYKLTKSQIKGTVEKAAWLLFKYCVKNNIHFLVVGSSGGLDSAVTLGLAKMACDLAKDAGYPLFVVGLIMPCHSTPDSVRLGRMAIEKFGAHEVYIDLSSIFDEAMDDGSVFKRTNAQLKDVVYKAGMTEYFTQNDWAWTERVAQGNIRARMRMMFGTYHVARMLRGMVLSTDNLSEFWMAFWTICGDVGDFGMIQQILKGLELYDIAEFIGVPEDILKAKPDDGLGIAGGDADQLGAEYPIVDRVMISLIQQGFDPDGSLDQEVPEVKGIRQEVVLSIADRAVRGSFKRNGTITLTREQLGLPAIRDIKL